jgi:hypothetical protein
MMLYRYVTDHRAGKWYPDLLTAQAQACAIGAGFLEPRTGEFYQYQGTRLESRHDGGDAQPGQQEQGIAA